MAGDEEDEASGLRLQEYDSAWEPRMVQIIGDEAAAPVADPRGPASGSDASVAAAAPAAVAVPLEGRLGRVVAEAVVEGGPVVVQTLDDGAFFELSKARLKASEVPLSAEDGCFDFAWPCEDRAVMDMGWEVGNLLGMRGWCTLQLPRSADLRGRAAVRAERQAAWARPKRELLPDLLGHQGAGKCTSIDPLKLKHEATLSAKVLAGLPPSDPLERLDADISSLYLSLVPVTWATLGFTSSGRTDAMVWMPFADGRERAELEPEDLGQEDVDEGVVERHLHFLRRRRIGFLYLADTEGGRLSLCTRDGLETQQWIDVPVGPGRLLLFRCDKFTFHYEPVGHHLTLLSWALEEAPQMELSEVAGDPSARDELWGILRGPGAPYHECARVLSIACLTGGLATDSGSATAMFSSGCDGQIRVPQLRFDTDIYFAKGDDDFISGVNSYHTHSGLCRCEDVMSFDNKFFGIPEDEATIMAPNQRKVLEVGYEALSGAGFTKKSMDGAPVMAYLGDIGSEWPSMLLSLRARGAFSDDTKYEPKKMGVHQLDWMSGFSLAATASRLSYVLGLTGPACHFDTACSSGLTAFCTAMYSLRSDSLAPTMDSRVQGALAGGVNQVVDPLIYIGNCSQGMVSHKGRCFTFDVGSDGYGRGEGTSIVYTTFGKQEKDMELQEGCAIGNKVNQDGRSASMTAPNGPSQQMCIKASLREAQVTPKDITASECHGTGTALGDPIEVGSLRGVQETDTRDVALLCTSSKSNIGHLEANAGTTGLIKCIMMGKYSIAPPNCHLRMLNPHLDVAGWPAVFETELCDFGQNSGLVGVSSFGVSGTNSHAEFWARCQKGPNAAARFANIDDPGKLDQLRVLCPVTLGPMDYLTGEPICGQEKVGRADIIRDELAPYDVSTSAYGGSFRFRGSAEAEEPGEELEPGLTLYACGSWTGFRALHEMELQDDGSYLTTFVLGETRCESFFLCLNKSPSMRIYPAITNAGSHLWIHGPDDLDEGRRWSVDGRDRQVPAGTVYQVRFWWGSERRKILWEEVPSSLAELAPRFEHRYAVLGTWTTWSPQEMQKDLDEAGVWEVSLRIGPSGVERFQFARDSDPQQLIYPARPNAFETDVPVRGPDDLGKGKSWEVAGRTDEEVRLRLQVDDGDFSVSVIRSAGASTVWRSLRGWARRQYCLSGSWNDWACEAMTMDPDKPGVFRYRAQMGDMFSEELFGFTEFFRILVDEDPDQSWFPELQYARSGECIVHGPGGESKDRVWMLRSGRPGMHFEVVLDLNAIDRRRIVSWSWEDPLALTYGAEAV